MITLEDELRNMAARLEWATGEICRLQEQLRVKAASSAAAITELRAYPPLCVYCSDKRVKEKDAEIEQLRGESDAARRAFGDVGAVSIARFKALEKIIEIANDGINGVAP